jgi:hypothetical protein
MPSKLAAVFVLPFIALFALTGSLLALVPANAAAPTTVKTVSPIDSTGALKPSYQVTRHIGHGTCQAGSYQTGDAYRCASPAAATNVLDPCWPLATKPNTMVCQDKPWVRKVIELHVAGTAAGGPSSRPTAMPWGVQVGADVRCLRDVGAVLRVDGNLLSYHCSHHRDLFGPLRSSGATWRAHVYRSDARTSTGEKSIGWQVVTIVWRGDAPASPTGSPSPSPTPPPTSTPSPTPTATG